MVVGDHHIHHHHHQQHQQIDSSKLKVGLAAVTLPQSSKIENTQLLTQSNPTTTSTNRPTSYASSTLASTSSSTTATLTRGSKKPLPAHFVDGVKASAALSASSTHQFGAINGDDHIDLDEMIPPTHVSPPPPPAQPATTNPIRMIDTDDDIDQLNDNLILETAMSKMGNGGVGGMVRMSEQISTSDMIGDGLDKHSYSFNNYDRHPPSFKTVMKTSEPKSPTSTAESHQYQNDDFDLDIHDSK